MFDTTGLGRTFATDRTLLQDNFRQMSDSAGMAEYRETLMPGSAALSDARNRRSRNVRSPHVLERTFGPPCFAAREFEVF